MWARSKAVLIELCNAARDPARDAHWSADGYRLSRKLKPHVWFSAAVLFIVTYVTMWSVVHVYIDQRPCALVLDDPLFHIIPYDARWYRVTHEAYTSVTVAALGALVLEAVLGDHRPLVTWGTALGLQAILRSITLLLLPLCRVTVAPGTRAITTTPLLHVGGFAIPWRVWASNDLVFSGHVGEFLLLYWAARHWPPIVRNALIAFQLLQVYALLGTRGHYTIDIVVAVPCALFEFRAALWLLLRLGGKRSISRENAPAVAHRVAQ